MPSARNIVLSGASFAALAQALTVVTPSSLVQCQPSQLKWGEGTAPYYVSIIPGGQPSAAPLESLPDQTGETYTWMVDIAAGTSVTVQVRDSTGEINYSDQVTIQAGTTTDCSSGASAGSAAPAAGSSSAAAGTSAVAAGSNSAASRMTASSSGSSRTAISPLSTSASSGNSTAGVNAAAAAASTSTTGAASVSAKVGAGMLLGAAGALVALVF